ncbi:MAG TPA: hypothetical protein PLC54_07820, partial [Spirochaetales bacterium]|nr:hypothetical protein [Spirochaetales bacterium]
HLPIHHDIRRPVPDASYIASLRDVVKQLSSALPEALSGLTYFFDPAEILKPCFYRLYRVDEHIYLYLLRVDLLPRPLECDVLQSGTNDKTPAYATKKLYLESEMLPLQSVMSESGRVKAFLIKQIISQTWIGETGKGYMVRGIWMDSDLSKFFTKLFVPDGVRLYPFYPLFCKYKTVCATSPILSGDGRRAIIPVLHRALAFIEPEIDHIQEALRNDSFSERLMAYSQLREHIPAEWKEYLGRFSTRSYLNADERKEYALDYVNP